MTIDMQINDKKKTPQPSIEVKSAKLTATKKKRWPTFFVIAIVLVVIGVIGFGIFKGLAIFEKVGLKIDTKSISLANKEPELKKDSTGKYTNFLIVGIDTREKSGGLNTDTIMLVSYNYDTNNIVMLSIPRDLSVEIGKGSKWYNKINSVYANAEAKKKGTGLEELKRTVEEMTNTEIQYYAMVNFEAFTQIIDAMGGIDINVGSDEAFTDTCYPAEKGDVGSHQTCCVDMCGLVKTISFKPGVQTMDGKTALEFARSRHSGSDFDRARRQQKVVLAVKDKITSTSTFTNPKAIMGIISSVSDNIRASEFTISDIQAGLNFSKTFDEKNGHSYSFVLDPSAGNGQLISNLSTYDATGALTTYIIGPKLGLGKYTDINEYVSLILDKPQLYNEDAKIYVYNTGLGYQETYKKVQTLREQYPYLNIVFKGTLYSDKEGNYIYSHTENEFITTVNEFATYLTIENKTKPEFVTTNLGGEDVTILFGKTIQLVNNLK